MSTVVDAPEVASPGPWFSSLPRWTTASDLLAMLAIGVALAVIVGGGFRIRVGEVRLSVTSPLGPLLIAFLLLGTRHALHRHPNIVERYGPRWAAFVRTAAWRATWPPFVASRLGLLIVGALAVYTVGYPRGEPRSRTSDNELLNLPMRWDAGWYYRIASVGYHWDPLETGQQNIAFFPAYPLTMRVVARLFGGSDMAYVFAGIAVSHVAFAWSLLLLYQLARATIGDEDAARGAVLLIACYPFSIYYGAIYTESLFLLGTVGAFLGFRRGRWAAAIAWGIMAGLTRPNGLLLAVPLAVMAIQSRWWRDHGSPWRRWAGPAAAVVAPLTGIAMFSIYIAALTGDPFAWSAQQAAWGRTFTGAGPVLTSAQAVADHGLLTFLATRPYDVINGAAVVAVACAIVPIGRRLGLAYAVFIVMNLLPPLAMGGTMSMGRFTSTMFPVFLWLAAASPKGTVGIAVAFAVLQGFFGVLFYTWRPLY
jgi:hypothetical protein